MFRWLTVGGGILGACLVLSACGKSAGDVGSDAAPLSKDDFAASYAQAVCENMAGCCESEQAAFDASHCKKVAKSFWQNELDAEAVLPGRIYDAQAAGACLKVLREQALCGALGWVNAEICGKIYAGNLDQGEACVSDAQCKEGSCAGASGQGDAGTCSKEVRPTTPHGHKGDACDISCPEGNVCDQLTVPAGTGQSSVACFAADGLYCSDAHKCEPFSHEGEACVDARECATGLGCIQGACGPKIEKGGSCSVDDDCVTGDCENSVCTSGVSAAQCKTSEPDLRND
jgi:hypothetical protein